MATASFRVGSKELFIPNVNICLIRGRNPNDARFQVPLWFSKLDLRDYLWHAYGVEILSVRSYVKQSRVQSGRPNDVRPAIRRWHRPRAKKFMTVALARPFVWPEEPESYAEWNLKEVKMGDEETRKFQEGMGSTKDTVINTERRERMKEQAKALLEGKTKWKAPEERWRFNTSFSRGHIATSKRTFSTSTRRSYDFRFADEQDAREDRLARVPQQLPEGEVDDLEQCQKDKRRWVLRIMNAVNTTNPSYDIGIGQVGSDYTRRNKMRILSHISTKMNNPLHPHELERCAWLLLDEVWRVHRVGFRQLQLSGWPALVIGSANQKEKTGYLVPMKCSERLQAIVHAIKVQPLIARDVISGDNLVQLASAPKHLLISKAASLKTHAKEVKKRLMAERKETESDPESG